ncbi:phage head completion protein [Streptomyces caeruleatus]|uniref:Head-tail adaptor protein n=1 Tax=Streptomyces caeruleatus TaxID=661399 RepID=A0A101TGR9_9ACTN|nr:head-tail adaptor protein [Streptomyces caeruleatus]KUN92037.1 head-tail adaptor protein [Streptomyces caeruleatus]
MRGRGSIGRYLNRRLEVHRPETADDGHGGQTTTLVLKGTVRAKVDQPSPTERMVAASTLSRHSHDIFMLPSADVRRGDELRGTDALGNDQVFRVQSVVQPSTPVYSKALVELTQGEGEPDG